jgi:hypothetical protein
MEIIKEAGEQPPAPGLHRRMAAELRPILAVRGAGTALVAGSLVLARRGWALLDAHLDGWERVGALAAAGYVTAYTAGQYPAITHFAAPGAVITWCVAAWCVAPPPARREPDPEPDDAEQPGEELTLDTLTTVVRRAAADRQGTHLADLLTEPEFSGWEQPALKAEILALGIPVEEFKLRFAGRQRVRDGVRLRDLPPPAAPTPAPPAAPSAPADPAPLAGPSPAPEPG